MERNFSQAVSCIPAGMASTRMLVLAWCAFNVCLHSPTRCYSHVHLEVDSKQERAQGTWRDLWGTSVYCELSGQGGGGGTHQRRGESEEEGGAEMCFEHLKATWHCLRVCAWNAGGKQPNLWLTGPKGAPKEVLAMWILTLLVWTWVLIIFLVFFCSQSCQSIFKSLTVTFVIFMLIKLFKNGPPFWRGPSWAGPLVILCTGNLHWGWK